MSGKRSGKFRYNDDRFIHFLFPTQKHPADFHPWGVYSAKMKLINISKQGPQLGIPIFPKLQPVWLHVRQSALRHGSKLSQ